MVAGPDEEEKILFSFLSGIAKGVDSSEKVTLGIIGIFGLAILNPTPYNNYLFVAFIFFIGIHYFNSQRPSPRIVNKKCPFCDASLQVTGFICPKCKRKID